MLSSDIRLVIVGEGAWGKALGQTFGSRFKDLQYLDAHSTRQDWSNALGQKSLVIIACPFRVVRETILKLRTKSVIGVINASKGIDQKTLQTFSGMAEKVLKIPFATISGPTFAQELQNKLPTAAVLASKNKNFSSTMATILSTPFFRLYTSTDIEGVEICAAVKNVLAIACGISDGLGLGHNARAALLTRGLVEISQLVEHLGGNASTAYGLAGVGDLWMTATGDLSRNRQLGLKLAKGLSAEEATKEISATCEGLYTVQQVEKLGKKFKADLPICGEVFQICYKNKDPKKSLVSLMTRDLKSEEPTFQQPQRKISAKRRSQL